MNERKHLKPENSTMLHGWMMTELGLKGSELILYSVIWGFTQHTENQVFSGSLGYLSEWANISKVSTIKVLNSLQEKGLIEKTEVFKNGVKFCDYRAADFNDVKETLPGVKKLNRGGKETLPGVVNFLNRGGKETLPQYIEQNKEEQLIEELKEGEYIPAGMSSAPASCKEIVDLFNQICISYPKVKSLSETRKKAIKARLRTYTLDDFKTLFEKAEASGFLRGSNGRDWSATFDWLIKDGNMAKVLDGNYDDKPKQKNQYGQFIDSVEDLYNRGLREWATGQ